MLGDEALKELISQAQAGNQQAKEQILNSNMNLVRSIVHRFTGRGYEWDDLFQIGCIGLIKAIDRFDLTYSVKFSTYAVPMIIGEIRRYIRDDNPMKVSRSLKELAYRVHRAQEKLQASLGRDPTVTEVAEELSLSAQEVIAAAEANLHPASLYEQTYRDDGDPILLLDQIKHSDRQETDFENFALREILAQLPQREYVVIQLRFFHDKTQAEIAAMIGLSQVQVSRIEKNALKMIKELLQTST